MPVFDDLKASILEMKMTHGGRRILAEMCNLDPSDRPSTTEAKQMITDHVSNLALLL